MLPDKTTVLSFIIEKLKTDLFICNQAVEVARDTATHKDCLGSSKYETMGTEASYLAHGQGTRLLELERALAYFKQAKISTNNTSVGLLSLIRLEDEEGNSQLLFLAADAGGLNIKLKNESVTVITHQSPLGRALTGKASDDDLTITIGEKNKLYHVLEIS